MNEIDLDKSGTVDFFEFLSVARLVTQQTGEYRKSIVGIKVFLCRYICKKSIEKHVDLCNSKSAWRNRLV